jgi:hypothetical protein
MKNKKTNKSKTEQKAEQLSDSGWINCPECNASIRHENIERHMKRVHGKNFVNKEKRIDRTKKAWGMAVTSVIIIIIAAAITGYVVLSPSLHTNGGQTIPPPPQPPPAFTPTYTIGSGANNYWMVYPMQHVSAGQPVAFPSWVTELAASKVLLICDHSIGCTPCDMQTKDIRSIMNNSKFSNGVTHIDLLSTGSDPNAKECFDVFDPDGTNHYIPLTIIVTKNPIGGYLWHSWEGVTGKSNLETWLNDAIYYHGG